MAFNNSEELQAVVQQVVGETTESPGDTGILGTHELPAFAMEEIPPGLEHHPCCIPCIYDMTKAKFSSHHTTFIEQSQHKYSLLVVKIHLCHIIGFALSY